MADLRGDELNSNTLLAAQIEVDHSRGVIYIHLTDPADITRLGTLTVLRIQGLPRNIPQLGPTSQFPGLTMMDINLRRCPQPTEDWYARVNWSGV